VFFTSPAYNHIEIPIAAKNITEHTASVKLSSTLENVYRKIAEKPSTTLKKVLPMFGRNR